MRSDTLRLPCVQPPTSLCTTSNFLVYNLQLPHITSKLLMYNLQLSLGRHGHHGSCDHHGRHGHLGSCEHHGRHSHGAILVMFFIFNGENKRNF